jgi:alkaline phosphatase
MKGRKRILTLVMGLMMITASMARADMPKYVFFFLGDGMSNAQIQATEAYLTTINGGSAMLAKDLMKPGNHLNMTKLPVQGI